MLSLLLIACTRPPSVTAVDRAGLPHTEAVAADAPLGPGERPPTAPDAQPASFLFEPLRVNALALELDDDAMDALRDDPRTDVPAVFLYGEERYPVGVHLKGRMSFRSFDGKPSLKVDFGELVEGGTFYGQRRLTLNNMVQDGSMMAEHLSYRMFRAAGVPSPRHGYAELTINGTYYGVYGVLESADEQWLAAWFGDPDGNLYKGGYGADIRAGRAWNFDLEEQGLAEPFEDIEALIEAIDGADTPVQGMDAAFGLDPLLDLFATEIVVGQEDGYVTYANNFLLYGATDGRWALAPWGTDQAFQSYAGPFDGFYGRLAWTCRDDAACHAALGVRIGEVIDLWEATDLTGYAASVRDTIAERCEEDPRREARCGANQDELMNYLAWRPGALREALAHAE